ncbi:hypothetical protein LCGC14_1790790 [marine sediment metagenome]|uniref:Uncharacterized protein n=1 Tax=marine sediment metagenome TaxID=412755 RepID=A0A0F9JS89_9ZZZZ
MPIAASDLKAFGAVNHAEDDTTLQGGAISTVKRIEFTPIATDDDIEAISSQAADTMNLTITARDTAGAIVSETLALTGTTAVIFATIGIVERFMKGVLASAATGVITIRRSVAGATIATLEIGETEVRRLFYDAASEVGVTTRVEKVFLKNDHATLTLTNAEIELTADPAATIRIGGAPTVDDTATVANRKATPASVTFVDDSVAQAVPGNELTAGQAIGVWAEMIRGASAAAIKDTFTVQLAGTTT